MIHIALLRNEYFLSKERNRIKNTIKSCFIFAKIVFVFVKMCGFCIGSCDKSINLPSYNK